MIEINTCLLDFSRIKCFVIVCFSWKSLDIKQLYLEETENFYYKWIVDYEWILMNALFYSQGSYNSHRFYAWSIFRHQGFLSSLKKEINQKKESKDIDQHEKYALIQYKSR